MRQRVWAAANVKLDEVTMDTDTTVHTLFGQQMGGRKSYNPKNKGKKSYQPMLTFIAETREYVGGELRNGDRPTGEQIADHLATWPRALPPGVKKVYARADSGFYCWEAVEAYEKMKWRFIMVARKTARLVDAVAGGEVEALAADRCRRPMRVPLSAGGMGQGLPFRGAALRKAARSQGLGTARAISTVRRRRSTRTGSS